MRGLAEERCLPSADQPEDLQESVERLHRLLQRFGVMFVEFLQRATSEGRHCQGSPSSSPRLAAFVAKHMDDGQALLRQLSQTSSSTRTA